MFDNTEFGISSRDAQAMAPATRKILENCFLALLDSGIDYRTRNVGTYTSGIAHEILTVSEPVSPLPLARSVGATNSLHRMNSMPGVRLDGPLR
jgi:acyl transferase domain-containing protein